MGALAIVEILSKVVGVVAQAKGPSSKARGAGAAGAILMGSPDLVSAFSPLLEAFMTGFVGGGAPQIEMLGMGISKAVFGYVVGWALTWITPKNS